MKGFLLAAGILGAAGAAFAAAEIRVTFPREGAVFPAGSAATYVMGTVRPADAPLTCNGKPVDVYRKTGAFLLMDALAPGEKRWVFRSGGASLTRTARVRAPAAAGPAEAEDAIRPEALARPTGVMTGEVFRAACRAPAGRRVFATIGERGLRLEAKPGSPTLYEAELSYGWPVEGATVVYWGDGLAPAAGGTVTARAAWPVYRVAGGLFSTRARGLPGDGDTVGFPPPGCLLQGAGFDGGWARCRAGGRFFWIARSALREAPAGSRPVRELPDLSVGYAARPAPGKKPGDLLVVLDPGHGGADTGALGPSGTFEKTANLRQALLARGALERAGFRVLMTRSDDTARGLYDRALLAYRRRADAFISIHHNSTAAATDPRKIRHFVSFGWNGRGLALARALHPGLAAVAGIPDGGVREKSLAVCRNPAVPSCLIEFDFINCPEGEDAIFHSGRMERYAEALAKGMLAWAAGADAGAGKKDGEK